MKGFSFKLLLPHFIAVAIFIVISALFFHPVFFEGKVMNQNDIVQGTSSGQEMREFREETGKEALWTNSMFGGMPAYLVNVHWSGDLLKYAQDAVSVYLPSPAKYTFLAMLCFYVLLLTYRVNPYLAIAGGIAYGINSFFIVSIEAGHIWKVSAIAYMPLVLAGIQTIIQKKTLLGISLTAIAVGLLIRSNHVQIAYYLFIVLLVFWIVYLIDAIRNKTLPSFVKITLFMAIGGGIGICANLGKLWTAYEYSPYTIRGKSELASNTQSSSGGLDRDYAFGWSNGIPETFTLLVPYFYGGASGEDVGTKSKLAKELRRAGVGPAQIRSITSRAPTYWGKQPFTSGPVYLGIIVIFLFIIGIMTVKGPLKSWLIAASILGLMLSWGKNLEWFNYFVFDYFPLYNKFRAVSMTLVIPLLCIPLLGFIGLSQALQNLDKKVLMKAFAITSGLLVLLLIASAFFSYRSPGDAAIGQQFFIDALIDQRASMFRSSAIRSLFFVGLGGALLYFYSLKKISQPIFLGSLIFIIFIDLYTIDKKYTSTDRFVKKSQIAAYQPDAADSRILLDEDYYRVVNLTVNVFNDATTSYYHSSIGGYHGAKLRRYNDVIEYHLNEELSGAISQIQNGSYNISNTPVLNMLNTRYFKLGNSSNAVLSNPNSQGNAWFVSEIKSVSSPDEAIVALGNEDLTQTVISEKMDSKQGLSAGSVSLEEYQPNYLKYSSSNSGEGFVVFSEIYYPKGWKATIDGNEVSIEQVNYLLRGLFIPAGDHVIEFKFEPSAYSIGNSSMMIGSIVSIALFIFAVAYSIKNHD